MELNVARTLSFPELDIEPKGDDGQDFTDQSEFPEKCDRPETPESDASTSGVCSLASSDFESSEENLEEKPKTQEEECFSCPVSALIFYISTELRQFVVHRKSVV